MRALITCEKPSSSSLRRQQYAITKNTRCPLEAFILKEVEAMSPNTTAEPEADKT